MNQKKGPHQTLNLLALWSWTCQPPELGGISVCSLSYPVCILASLGSFLKLRASWAPHPGPPPLVDAAGLLSQPLCRLLGVFSPRALPALCSVHAQAPLSGAGGHRWPRLVTPCAAQVPLCLLQGTAFGNMVSDLGSALFWGPSPSSGGQSSYL